MMHPHGNRRRPPGETGAARVSGERDACREARPRRATQRLCCAAVGPAAATIERRARGYWISLLASFDFALSTPPVVTADTAKYQRPPARLFSVQVVVSGLLIASWLE